MDNCIGCGNCATNCPYGVIQMAAVESTQRPNLFLRLLFGWGEAGDTKRPSESSDQKVAVKCDLCRELQADGNELHAACVASCPTGAIVRVDPKHYVDTMMEDDL